MHFHVLVWDIGSLVSTFCVFISILLTFSGRLLKAPGQKNDSA